MTGVVHPAEAVQATAGYYRSLALAGGCLALLLGIGVRHGMGAHLDRWTVRLARRPGAAVTLVGLLAFTISAFLSLAVHRPVPATGDEFSYLLAADTFAHGRLTNPPHPLWVDLESFAVLQQPTYASKYPPAQGLILAAGKVIGGSPVVGLWLSAGLECAAYCWMLLAWLPPRWAFRTALLSTVHPLVLDWGQMFWGGAVAAAGGALLLGSLRRLLRCPRPLDGALFGLGLAILANSRPYEGLVLAVLSGLLALLEIGRPRERGHAACRLREILAKAGAPLLLVLAIAGSWTAFYNFRVTGHPLLMPYQLFSRTYERVPLFNWQPLRPAPVYHHPILAAQYSGSEVVDYWNQHSLRGFLNSASLKTRGFISGAFRLFDTSGDGAAPVAIPFPFSLFCWTLLALLALLPQAMRRDWWTRAAVGMLAVFDLALCCDLGAWPHYAAPAASLVLVVLGQCWRQLSLVRWRGRRVGRALARALPLLFAASFVTICFQFSKPWPWQAWANQRAAIVQQLSRGGQRNLVIVRYGSVMDRDYVYNGADLAASPVVWIREPAPEDLPKLKQYFPDRRFWLLDATTSLHRLAPLDR